MHEQVGERTHHSGAFLSLETGRNAGGKPQPPRPRACVCTVLATSSMGEASTCPIPEQGAGVVAAHPQPGRPDSEDRNEGGGHNCPGGLSQELEPSRPDLVPPPHPTPRSKCAAGQPRSQDSGCSEALGLDPWLYQRKNHSGRGLGPSHGNRTQSICRFHSFRDKTKRTEYNKNFQVETLLHFSKHFLF